MFIEDLSAFLQANAGVSGIAGNRVYGKNLAQNAVLPAVVYKQYGKQIPSSMEGVTGLTHETIQIEAYANDYLTTKNLATALRKALVKFSGTMGGTVVLDVDLDQEHDIYDFDKQQFLTQLDFKFWHREP